MSQTSPEPSVHFEYKVDLANPSVQSLDEIKSELARKIAENVRVEQENLRGAGAPQLASHDRHYSIHSRDAMK